MYEDAYCETAYPTAEVGPGIRVRVPKLHFRASRSQRVDTGPSIL